VEFTCFHWGKSNQFELKNIGSTCRLIDQQIAGKRE